jgi:hypothetical protein
MLQPEESGAKDIVRNVKGTDMIYAVSEYYILFLKGR